ncbi:hypothetical protein LJR066_000603 [Acidovorax sp. LjRoot66]|uniref:hypothetical protein n=1 Tax=Acidovorax sp. LjRoot66 TaxID=3342334 RepID=UPI003ECD31E9
MKPTTIARSTEVVFCWFTRAHAVDRTGQIVLRRGDVLGVIGAQWLWDALRAKARSTQAKPIAQSSLGMLKAAFEDVCGLASWVSLCSATPSEISLEMVVGLFAEFESFLLKKYGSSQSYRESSAFRSFVGKAVVAVSSDARLRQLKSFYKSKCSFKPIGRPLLSDVVHHSRPTLGSLQHESIKDLHAKTILILENDLSRVRQSALQILRTYSRCCDEINRISAIDISGRESVVIAKALSYRRNKNITWTIEEVEEYIALRIMVSSGRWPKISVFRDVKIPSAVYEHAKNLSEASFADNDFVGWIRSRELPAVEILIACSLILQIKTGWNFSSVLELSFESVDVRSFPHRLQSVKTRPGDETPLVLIEKGDDDVLLALEVLFMRARAMDQAGVRHSGIWTGRRASKDGIFKRVAKWNLGLFCKKYDLPNFSPEMLRGQVLAVDAVNKGNLALAQSRAGHSISRTTFHYVNKDIIRRLNSANSLEFEKRFDATIRYMIDPGGGQSNRAILSYPIGDGSSCVAPASPPADEWLNSGICSAKHCHQDGGCKNRVIHIDSDRIEELVLTKSYYERSWKRLLDENPAAFEKNHLPNMLFTFGLFGAVARGPYRHLINRVSK